MSQIGRLCRMSVMSLTPIFKVRVKKGVVPLEDSGVSNTDTI
jgi:hypothetical protein